MYYIAIKLVVEKEKKGNRDPILKQHKLIDTKCFMIILWWWLSLCFSIHTNIIIYICTCLILSQCEDPWQWWNTLRTLCDNNAKLHLRQLYIDIIYVHAVCVCPLLNCLNPSFGYICKTMYKDALRDMSSTAVISE